MQQQDTRLIGDELLVSVFAQFEKGTKFNIVDEHDIIKAFYTVHEEYPDLFENYAFDNDGIYPDSIELSEAIDSMMQSRMLGRMNVDLKDYYIFDAIHYRFEKFIKPKLSESQIQELKELAMQLTEELQINTNN